MSEGKTLQPAVFPLGIDIGSTTVKIAVLNQQH